MREVRLRDLNWLGEIALDALPPEGLDVAVRVRSTRAPREARLMRDEAGLKIELASDEEGVSPGQACVIYADAGPGARVLGGGTILRPAARRCPRSRPVSRSPCPDAGPPALPPP